MTLEQFHTRLKELLYIEDEGMYNIIMASIVANSLKIGDPVWLTLIGPSSGGKSQIIRPFAIAQPKLIHRLDDMTPNTFISGTQGVDGSFLGRLGKHGIISMDDLTVMFSKNAEARGEILSQFRMVYDGRFSKSSGNRKDTMVWEGYVGMISGSTPSIYKYFAEVADMGERFINYRMKGFSKHKAVEFITKNTLTAHELDGKIAELINGFMGPMLALPNLMELSVLDDETKQNIATVSEHATLLRTAVHIDERSGYVDEFPEPEMPFRVMKQLTYLARGLQAINGGKLTPEMMASLEWVGWSLANDKRRAFLKAMVVLDYSGKQITKRNVSVMTGLHETIVERGLSQLQALNIITKTDESSTVHKWTLINRDLQKLTLRLDPPDMTASDDIDE